MVSHLSLSDKSLQVSRSLLSILADFNNAVVWMVSTRPVISKSSSSCTNPLVTVPRAPITIDIIATFMFHNFSQYLSIFSSIFNFTLWSAIFIIILFCEFFTPALAGGFSLESKRQQVYSSLLKFFFGLWPISTILKFGWYPLILLFPSPRLLVSILWWLYQIHQLQFVSLLPSCSIISFFSSLAGFFAFFQFFQWSAGTATSSIRHVFLFFGWLSLGLIIWTCLSDPFVSQNHWKVCASHFLGRILCCAYTICSYGQI